MCGNAVAIEPFFRPLMDSLAWNSVVGMQVGCESKVDDLG